MLVKQNVHLEDHINLSITSDFMAKSISCADAGSECTWSTTADTEEELMDKVAQHVKAEHPDLEITPEQVEKIKSIIKEV